MSRDRVTDLFDLVHYADGTKVTLQTGRIFIKTVCGLNLTRHSDKTSKQVAPTCFACIHYMARAERLYAGRHLRGAANGRPH